MSCLARWAILIAKHSRRHIILNHVEEHPEARLGGECVGRHCNQGQQPSAKQLAEECEQAELDAPKLAAVLEVKPGMTIADVGAGGGAMTVVLGKWIGTGRVFATDIVAKSLVTIRDYVTREGLNNVTVIEGASASTNLPAACCDAIFLRHVYHHIADYEAFNTSLHRALKPGGRLAIIDLVPRNGSKCLKACRPSRRPRRAAGYRHC
jgi:cyclopropane fatty-acyl-phospholipid synthase-like methyltransferase